MLRKTKDDEDNNGSSLAGYKYNSARKTRTSMNWKPSLPNLWRLLQRRAELELVVP